MGYIQHITSIEIIDDTGEMVCKISTFDESSVALEIFDAVMTANAWKGLSDRIYESILTMVQEEPT